MNKLNITEEERKIILQLHQQHKDSLITEEELDEQLSNLLRTAARYGGKVLRGGENILRKAAPKVKDAVRTAAPKVKDAVRTAAPKFKDAMNYGWKQTPWNRTVLTKIISGDLMGIVRYAMGNPLPKGGLREMIKLYGVGPAIASMGVGLFKQWIGLMVSLSIIRTVMSAAASTRFTSLKEINDFFGIEEYEDMGDWKDNFLSNIWKNIYLPSAEIFFRGWLAIPWFLNHTGDTLRYLDGIFSSVFDPSDPDTFIDAVRKTEVFADDKLKNLEEQAQNIPQDLLNSVPADKRNEIKITDEDGIFWRDPDYMIQKLGNDYVVLIPGSGWYKLNDVE